MDDDPVKTQLIGATESVLTNQAPPNAANAKPEFTQVTIDLTPYAGRKVTLRLYHWLAENSIPGSAYWRYVKIE